jgi:hypothetical protein
MKSEIILSLKTSAIDMIHNDYLVLNQHPYKCSSEEMWILNLYTLLCRNMNCILRYVTPVFTDLLLHRISLHLIYARVITL